MYPITDGMMERLNNSFTYHAPKNDQPERYNLLRNLAKELAVELLKNIPDGRERLLAITKLEECIMWANKGIACGE